MTVKKKQNIWEEKVDILKIDMIKIYVQRRYEEHEKQIMFFENILTHIIIENIAKFLVKHSI